MLNSALFLFSAKHNSQQQQNHTQKLMDLMVQEAKHVSDENISIISVGVGEVGGVRGGGGGRDDQITSKTRSKDIKGFAERKKGGKKRLYIRTRQIGVIHFVLLQNDT